MRGSQNATRCARVQTIEFMGCRDIALKWQVLLKYAPERCIKNKITIRKCSVKMTYIIKPKQSLALVSTWMETHLAIPGHSKYDWRGKELWTTKTTDTRQVDQGPSSALDSLQCTCVYIHSKLHSYSVMVHAVDYRWARINSSVVRANSFFGQTGVQHFQGLPPLVGAHSKSTAPVS